MTAANPALERLMMASVRVGTGSGVLVASGTNTIVATANHVTASDVDHVPVRVRSGFWHECHVLARDEAADLAILSAPPSLDGLGIEVLQRTMVPGEDVWTCGFPRGWTNNDGPVLGRGMVAGTAQENWANLEASWGNSGGPLVLIVNGNVCLGGIALGKGGDAHGELEEFKQTLDILVETLEESDATVEEMKDRVNSHRQRLKTSHRTLEINRRAFRQALKYAPRRSKKATDVRDRLAYIERELGDLTNATEVDANAIATIEISLERRAGKSSSPEGLDVGDGSAAAEVEGVLADPL